MLAALLTNLAKPAGKVNYRENPWKDFEPKEKKKKKPKDELVLLTPH